MNSLVNQYKSLEGPILVIGASGFVGSNLFRHALSVRDDVIGTVFTGQTWRLRNLSAANIAYLNLQDNSSIRSLFHRIRPRTIFNCSSFGSYSFEQDFARIHETNYLTLIQLLEFLSGLEFSAYIHAGSSSEYGLNASGPTERSQLLPNSHYAVSKAAASHAIAYFGKVRKLPVVNMRLYSIYGPYEDSSRLIPTLCERSLNGSLPTFASPEVSRDFIHVDDVASAFAAAALRISPAIYGDSFNIGTGACTTLSTLAKLAQDSFDISSAPSFNTGSGRNWDVENWYANPATAQAAIGWQAQIALADGLRMTQNWWRQYLETEDFNLLTKKSAEIGFRSSVSAIIACYRDERAIPIMHARLAEVFQRLTIDYEIIFVNDGSPDNSAEIIRAISAKDPNVIGITHSRNFGSQAAFRSGMEVASKQACVLLDGDLQDPPEVIEQFVQKWQAGADVVYGRRIKREMPRKIEMLYRLFYRIFAAMSEVPLPKDAGDFSLIDRTVVWWMLQCQERDSFLRGLRAYVGFKQVPVDYVRPERMFGVSTNNWIKNIGWAKKAIFSFSRLPLHMLTTVGGIAVAGTILLAIMSICIRLFSPDSVPKGITFLSILVMVFGSLTILGIGLLGEYIGKILEETKGRPPFIRRHIIKRGTIEPAPIQSLRS